MYPIEIRLASKNGWHTPAEARAYYGKYDRMGVTWHWWNTPQAVQDSDHDNIVNYILGKANAGSGSVNYVLSNNKISMLVNPDNVAWASQSGNPVTVSVELSPHLNAEGYKKAGWLFNELEGRYGRVLKHYKHSDWFQTACPGSIDVGRIAAEAAKWKSGGYNPQPEWKTNLREIPTKTLYAIDDTTPLRNLENVGQVIENFAKGTPFEIKGQTVVGGNPYYLTKYSFDNGKAAGFDFYELQDTNPNTPPPEPPKPPVINQDWALWKDGGTYVANKQPTNLYDLSGAETEAGIKIVKSYNKGELIEIAGQFHNNPLNRDYYITRYSFDKKNATGFAPADLDIYAPPVPTPPTPDPEPTEPTDPTPTPEPEPEYPSWFMAFWLKLIDAIKSILHIK
jgi:hypothetical protein